MLKALLTPLTALTLVACCLPAGAAAETLVPPGNSAANQYTQTFPTSKGEEDEQGKKKSGVTPAQVLGAGKAHELEDQGPAGKAVADFAAETSPTSAGGGDSGEERSAGGGNDSPGRNDHPKPQPEGGGTSGGKKQGEKPESAGGSGGGGQTPSGGSGGSAQPSGSSGFGEVVSQATGTSSGSLGWLLPLVLIAVVIWSIAYVWRTRQHRVV